MKTIHRFILANVFACCWAGLSLFLAQWWLDDISQMVGSYYAALAVVLFIAIVPGYLNILLLSSLLFYVYEPLEIEDTELPPITLMIAVYNGAEAVKETFRGIKQQEYPNTMEIIVIDDGSTDGTVEELKKIDISNLKIVQASHGGKAHALNIGLKEASHELIVTIDADTFLYKNAVKRITARILKTPNCAAVAGHVLVRNERRSRLVRIQSWDYMLGISAVKRQQALFEGTLVAQGAFSMFRKKALLEVKGWKNKLGEDIVLTWTLLKKNYRIEYEPTAFAFTNAPLHYKGFYRQRLRWSRGMIEGFKENGSIIWENRRYSSFFVALNLTFPIIDLFYTFVFIPGLIMALFGNYAIVGLMTLFVIPINLLINCVMLRTQKRFMDYAGLTIRYNPVGIVFYVLIYQIIMSPICVVGYFKELLGFKKKW